MKMVLDNETADIKINGKFYPNKFVIERFLPVIEPTTVVPDGVSASASIVPYGTRLNVPRMLHKNSI